MPSPPIIPVFQLYTIVPGHPSHEATQSKLYRSRRRLLWLHLLHVLPAGRRPSQHALPKRRQTPPRRRLRRPSRASLHRHATIQPNGAPGNARSHPRNILNPLRIKRRNPSILRPHPPLRLEGFRRRRPWRGADAVRNTVAAQKIPELPLVKNQALAPLRLVCGRSPVHKPFLRGWLGIQWGAD